MTAESPASDLNSILLLLFDTSPDHFHHFAFVWGKTADLADDSAHSSNTLVESALAVRLADLLGVSVSFGLGNDEAVIEANVNSTLL